MPRTLRTSLVAASLLAVCATTADAASYRVLATGRAQLEPLLARTTPAAAPTATSIAARYRATGDGIGIVVTTASRHAAGGAAYLTIPTSGLVLLRTRAQVEGCSTDAVSRWTAALNARNAAGDTRVAQAEPTRGCARIGGELTTPIAPGSLMLVLRARYAASTQPAGTSATLRELALEIADDQAPALDVALTRASTATTTARLEVGASDRTSGVARVEVRIDGGAPTVLFAGHVDSTRLRGQATAGAATPGALAATIALPRQSGDHHIDVTATDVAGNASTSTVLAHVTLPPLAGEPGPSFGADAPRVGVPLVARHGAWLDAPERYAYTWLRRTGGGDVLVGRAATYTPTRADARAGGRLVLRVMATNAAGSSSADTPPSDVVAPAVPVALTTPAVVGAAVVDAQLVVTPGTWDDGGAPRLRLAYRWLACTAADATSCEVLAERTSSAFEVPAAALGRRLRVVEVASNASGGAESPSTLGASVVAAPPSFVAPPSIAGGTAVGATVALDPGDVAWHGAGGDVGVRLLRCAEDGGACVALAASPQTTYTIAPDDRGHALVLEATATSAAGSVTARSSTHVVPSALAPPLPPQGLDGRPLIVGTPRVGELLTLISGRFTGIDAFTLARRWERCDAAAAHCVAIVADAAAYRVAAADIGRRIRVVETARNDAGSAQATSEATLLVTDRRHVQLVTGSGLGWTAATVDGIPMRLDARLPRTLVTAGATIVVRGRLRVGRGLPRPSGVRVTLRLDAPLAGGITRTAAVAADGRFVVRLPARFGGQVEVATRGRGYVRPLAAQVGRLRVRPRITAAVRVTRHDLIVTGRLGPAAPGLGLDLLVRWPGSARWVLFGVEQEPVVTRTTGRFRRVLHSDSGYLVSLLLRARFRVAYRAEGAGPLTSASSPAIRARR